MLDEHFVRLSRVNMSQSTRMNRLDARRRTSPVRIRRFASSGRRHTETASRRQRPDRAPQQIIDRVPAVITRERFPELDATLARAGPVLLPDDSGTGIKNHAIHAMALGTIVIGTPAALEGIPVESGRHAFICCAQADFGSTIAMLRSPGADPLPIERAASRFVREHYSDDVVSVQWKPCFGMQRVTRRDEHTIAPNGEIDWRRLAPRTLFPPDRVAEARQCDEIRNIMY